MKKLEREAAEATYSRWRDTENRHAPLTTSAGLVAVAKMRTLVANTGNQKNSEVFKEKWVLMLTEKLSDCFALCNHLCAEAQVVARVHSECL